jgi:hypothetical protein
MNAQDRMDIQIASTMINSLERLYSPACDTKDYEDFPDIGRGLNDISRCYNCRISEVIEFLKEHIELIKWMNDEEKI